MLSPRQMEIFSSVYEEGGMTAAAKRIHMSQPAVSQAIKEIEDQYGIELFERIGSKLFVTQAGEKLYDYSKQIIALYQGLDEALYVNDGVNEIRVGANISAGTAHLLDLIKKFSKKHPDINVRTMVFQAPVIINSLKNNELDLALIEDQDDPSLLSDFNIEPYYKDKIIVVCSNNHRFANKTTKLASLSDETFLFRERGAGVRDMFDNILKSKKMNVSIGWECTSTEAIVDAVKNDIGIAVLPYLLVKKYLKAKELSEITINDVWLSRNLNIVYHKEKVLTHPLKDFIGLVKATK